MTLPAFLLFSFRKVQQSLISDKKCPRLRHESGEFLQSRRHILLPISRNKVKKCKKMITLKGHGNKR
jgi:hypothetical protein